jgi:hypothetical protein
MRPEERAKRQSEMMKARWWARNRPEMLLKVIERARQANLNENDRSKTSPDKASDQIRWRNAQSSARPTTAKRKKGAAQSLAEKAAEGLTGGCLLADDLLSVLWNDFARH